MRRKVSMRLSKSKQQQRLQQDDNKGPEISLPTLQHSSITFKDATEIKHKQWSPPKLAGGHPIRLEQQVRAGGLSKHEIQNEFEKLLESFDQEYTELVDQGSTGQLISPAENTASASPLKTVSLAKCEEMCSSCAMIVESRNEPHTTPATPMRQSSRRFSLQCADFKSDSPFAALEALSSPFKLPPLESDLDLFQEYMNSPSKRFHSPVSVQSEPYSFDFSVGQTSRPPLPVAAARRPQLNNISLKTGTQSTSPRGSSSDITPTLSSSTEHTKSSQLSSTGTLKTALVRTNVAQLVSTTNPLPRLSSQRMVVEFEQGVG